MLEFLKNINKLLLTKVNPSHYLVLVITYIVTSNLFDFFGYELCGHVVFYTFVITTIVLVPYWNGLFKGIKPPAYFLLAPVSAIVIYSIKFTVYIITVITTIYFFSLTFIFPFSISRLNYLEKQYSFKEILQDIEFYQNSLIALTSAILVGLIILGILGLLKKLLLLLFSYTLKKIEKEEKQKDYQKNQKKKKEAEIKKVLLFKEKLLGYNSFPDEYLKLSDEELLSLKEALGELLIKKEEENKKQEEQQKTEKERQRKNKEKRKKLELKVTQMKNLSSYPETLELLDRILTETPWNKSHKIIYDVPFFKKIPSSMNGTQELEFQEQLRKVLKKKK